MKRSLPWQKQRWPLKLKKKLHDTGVTNKLVVYPDSGHGWSESTLTKSFNAFLKQ